MSAPFISVIIPALNEASYLPKLLGDLARQTTEDFEVIVVDGGSVDETLVKIKPYQKHLRLKIMTTEANVSSQRNKGAKEAQGAYLVFFDADVRLPRNYLKEVINTIRLEQCYFYTTLMAVKGRSQTQITTIEFINFMLELFNALGKPFVPGFNIIIEHDLFKRLHGFDPGLKLAEDHDLAQRARKLGVMLKILKEPIIYASLRRPEKMGYIKLLSQYAISSLYTFMGEPIRKELFNYPMGGHIYQPTAKDNPLVSRLRALKQQIKHISRKIELPF